MNDSKKNGVRIPLLPLRDVVIFPGMVVPLFIGREKSIHTLEECVNKKRTLFLVTQKRADMIDPGQNDLFEIGTLGVILQFLRSPDHTVKVLIEGKKRARILNYYDSEKMIEVEVEKISDRMKSPLSLKDQALLQSLKGSFKIYLKWNKKIPAEILMDIQNIHDPVKMIDLIVVHLDLKLREKQEILEIQFPDQRLEKLLQFLQKEIAVFQMERRIRLRVKKQIERSQKEYYLNEQIRAIQEELGEVDEFKADLQEIEKQIFRQLVNSEAQQKALKELKKLKLMSPLSAEAVVVRNYIEWLIELPWNQWSIDSNNLKEAQKILNEDHYGLDEAKERILEYLAVRVLTNHSNGQILCLVGPPGVGKTSLAKSIARALNKKFIRCSLGGVRDEAEIRGHRRTYVGALPGRIIQSFKKVGVCNPVFFFDEVDKMSMNFQGDPSAALLEVLDPEQNANFWDHYLEVDYDLSKVLFILAANSLDPIPKPLLDRMEVISITGYTEDEKLNIVKRYLLHKQIKAHGLQEEDLVLSENIIRTMIRNYTRESGVRNLERKIAMICRKLAKRKIEGESHLFTPSLQHDQNLEELLGPPENIIPRREKQNEIGLAYGLAYTESGGDLLQIEVGVVSGKGKIKMTGKLGEVMQESVQTAMSYVRSRAQLLGLEKNFYQSVDIHLHIPEGAVPKDGASAGITIATAITSALTKIPVKQNIAMTGEMTLRGRILAIGGLREKLLAAYYSEIQSVFIPTENLPELKKIPEEIQTKLQIIPVEHADAVLRWALQLKEPHLFLAPKKMIRTSLNA